MTATTVTHGETTTDLEPRAWLRDAPTWTLALATLIGLVMTGARWSVPVLAWLSPVPLLLLARRLDRRREWLALAGLLAVGVTLQVLKIITAPVPAAMSLVFALPAAAGLVVVVAVTEWVRRRAGEHAGVAVFATLSALGDLAVCRFTELGAWMTGASTQASSVLVLQLAAIAGVWGIGLAMAWTAGVLASLIARGPRDRMGWHALALGALLLALLGWATLRLDRAQGGTVTVAAVTTDIGLDASGMPAPDVLARNADELFARSAEAAARGARVISWPEAATVVRPAEEAALIARARAFAIQHRVDLALAYGVLVSEAPLLLDNKVSLVTDDGAIAQTYRKHHPVPGEPSRRGTEPLSVVARPYGVVGLAICYDFDFPALAREYARQGAQLMIVPSSDWPGIDPVHAELARMRAIEGGFSLLRSVRWASSAAFDGLGRVRGILPGREAEKVLVAAVPVEQVATVYTRLGDAPALALFAPLLVAFGAALRRRQRTLPST